jgi:hypothetical protein
MVCCGCHPSEGFEAPVAGVNPMLAVVVLDDAEASNEQIATETCQYEIKTPWRDDMTSQVDWWAAAVNLTGCRAFCIQARLFA